MQSLKFYESLYSECKGIKLTNKPDYSLNLPIVSYARDRWGYSAGLHFETLDKAIKYFQSKGYKFKVIQ